MKAFFFMLLMCLLFFSDTPGGLGRESDCCGRCVGSAYCTACKTCNYCAHCNSGGSCGVCAGGASGRARYSAPARSPRTSPAVTLPYGNSIQYESDFYRESSKAAAVVPTVYRVSAKALYLRAGPGTHYEALASLPRGTQVTVGDRSYSPWYRVKVRALVSGIWAEVEGYVHSHYLEP